MLDLSNGAGQTVVVDAEALRARVVPYIAEALIPQDATLVRVEFWRMRDGQAHVRLAGHTAACVAVEAIKREFEVGDRVREAAWRVPPGCQAFTATVTHVAEDGWACVRIDPGGPRSAASFAPGEVVKINEEG